MKLNKYVLEIKGMRCGMCAMHVEDAITKNFKVKKAKASYFKGELMLLSELDLTLDDFHQALDPTGYEIKSFDKRKAVKKFLGWK